jgi:hypothetical protein
MTFVSHWKATCPKCSHTMSDKTRRCWECKGTVLAGSFGNMPILGCVDCGRRRYEFHWCPKCHSVMHARVFKLGSPVPKLAPLEFALPYVSALSFVLLVYLANGSADISLLRPTCQSSATHTSSAALSSRKSMDRERSQMIIRCPLRELTHQNRLQPPALFHLGCR